MLAPGKHVAFSLRNVNVSSKSTKNGWKYEIKGEVTQDDYMQFQESDLTGSLFEVHDMECVEVAIVKPKGGPLSQNAAMLRQDLSFGRYVKDVMGFEDVKKYMYTVCGVESLAELDSEPSAAAAYEALRRKFHDWERSS